MSSQPLAGLPDHLEQLASNVSERLMARFRDGAPASLAEGGVLTARTRSFFDDRSVPFEPLLDRFTALAFYTDSLMLLTLACLNARPVVDWARLDGARLLLTRIGTFYAAILPRYAAFRNLPREKLTDFLNVHAMDDSPFGFRSEDTRLLGMRLCRFLTVRRAGDFLGPYINDGLMPLWQYLQSRAGLNAELAAQIWGDVCSVAS